MNKVKVTSPKGTRSTDNAPEPQEAIKK